MSSSFVGFAGQMLKNLKSSRKFLRRTHMQSVRSVCTAGISSISTFGLRIILGVQCRIVAVVVIDCVFICLVVCPLIYFHPFSCKKILPTKNLNIQMYLFLSKSFIPTLFLSNIQLSFPSNFPSFLSISHRFFSSSRYKLLVMCSCASG